MIFVYTHMKEKKSIGILGGMGPEATAFMFRLFIQKTQADKDQDHPIIIIYSNPKTPPRTDAIFKSGEDPVPYLIKGASVLKKSGADIIVMPCITAHYFIKDVRKKLDFNFISLVDEAVKWTINRNPDVKRIGLLSSKGTIKARIFHKAFEKRKINLITPSEKEQKTVMESIFGNRGIKAGHKTGRSRENILSVAHSLINQGAEALITGCTEIPMALKKNDINVLYIEPMSITVTAALKAAGYKIKKNI